MIDSHDPLGSLARAETAVEQIEIPVPAPERQHMGSAAADTVITVGQKSQQKQKRKRNPVMDELEDVEMFDYAIEPSLLDVGDVKKVGPVIKKRNTGKRVWCCIESQL